MCGAAAEARRRPPRQKGIWNYGISYAGNIIPNPGRLVHAQLLRLTPRQTPLPQAAQPISARQSQAMPKAGRSPCRETSLCAGPFVDELHRRIFRFRQYHGKVHRQIESVQAESNDVHSQSEFVSRNSVNLTGLMYCPEIFNLRPVESVI